MSDCRHAGTDVPINVNHGKTNGITLLHCPFCDAKADVLSDGTRTWGLIEHREGCLFPSYPKHEIPESDFEAWNTRHERTCRWEPADYITEGDWWNTECGEAITWEPEGTPNFCPNCGGKVEVDA